jgi:3-deoxy-manno-octulosonate cytidylyltransferase (CMP-KDO synthetase)
MSKILTIIPARMASARLPNKPLADILGKPMILRVYEQAKKTNLGEVIVACDSKEIADIIDSVGGKAIITDPNLPSGTDRIFAALQKISNNQEFDVIINLQGDLPTIDPQIIIETAQAILKANTDIATVASVIKNDQEVNNPNIVKIALTQAIDILLSNNLEKNLDPKLRRALYFSRSAIPYGAKQYYHHIGIYAYKHKALKEFVSLSPSALEKIENLEQLRALENQMSIAVKIVDYHPLSVDDAQDLEWVRSFVKNQQNI